MAKYNYDNAEVAFFFSVVAARLQLFEVLSEANGLPTVEALREYEAWLFDVQADEDEDADEESF